MAKDKKEHKHPSKEKETHHGKETTYGKPEQSKNKPFGHGPGCSCSSCK